jgi:hypothetical protein
MLFNEILLEYVMDTDTNEKIFIIFWGSLNIKLLLYVVYSDVTSTIFQLLLSLYWTLSTSC